MYDKNLARSVSLTAYSALILSKGVQDSRKHLIQRIQHHSLLIRSIYAALHTLHPARHPPIRLLTGGRLVVTGFDATILGGAARYRIAFRDLQFVACNFCLPQLRLKYLYKFRHECCARGCTPHVWGGNSAF